MNRLGYARQLFLFSINSLLITIFVAPMNAQSNFDLQAPVQADVRSQEVVLSPDPKAIPTFQFAVASLGENGKVVVNTASVKQKLVAKEPPTDPSVETYTENVLQNYTVQVPYTETVDGKNVTKVRTETRTRTVPVTRTRRVQLSKEKIAELEAEKEKAKREGREDEFSRTEMVEVSYTVNIPKTKTVDGRNVTVMVPTTQLRKMSVVRGKTKTERVDDSNAYDLGDVKCFTVDGSPIDSEALKERLVGKAPVILIRTKESISPYFGALLKPDAIFMVQPE